jgi:hypothetical protein
VIDTADFKPEPISINIKGKFYLRLRTLYFSSREGVRGHSTNLSGQLNTTANGNNSNLVRNKFSTVRQASMKFTKVISSYFPIIVIIPFIVKVESSTVDYILFKKTIDPSRFKIAITVIIELPNKELSPVVKVSRYFETFDLLDFLALLINKIGLFAEFDFPMITVI